MYSQFILKSVVTVNVGDTECFLLFFGFIFTEKSSIALKEAPLHRV